MTKQVVEAGKLLGISVLDHVIVGGGTGKLYSFRENDPELFSGAPDMAAIRKMQADPAPGKKKPVKKHIR